MSPIPRKTSVIFNYIINLHNYNTINIKHTSLINYAWLNKFLVRVALFKETRNLSDGSEMQTP